MSRDTFASRLRAANVRKRLSLLSKFTVVNSSSLLQALRGRLPEVHGNYKDELQTTIRFMQLMMNPHGTPLDDALAVLQLIETYRDTLDISTLDRIVIFDGRHAVLEVLNIARPESGKSLCIDIRILAPYLLSCRILFYAVVVIACACVVYCCI
jgi:hypothetical protein